MAARPRASRLDGQRSARPVAASLVLLLGAGLLLAPDLDARQQRPVFRAKTEIVQIDVTVLGPDGRPWQGLAREDFTLFEDGEPQDILGFGEVRIPDASEGPPWLRETTPDVRTTTDGRVLVFLIDDAQLRYDYDTEIWKTVVGRMTDAIIDRMGSADVAAVVCTYSDKCDQDFTSDRARLRAAIAHFRPREAVVANRVSAGMAQSVTRFLREETGRRRTIIYVTPRQPIRPAIWPPPPGNLSANVTAQQMLRTFEEAARARVTVYTLTTTGLRQLAADGPLPGASTTAFSAPARSLAAETGGFTIGRPDQFEEGVSQIFRETGSYYLLGYEQPPKKDTGYNMLAGFRAIDVRVNRPGATVRTHRGYTAVSPASPPRKPVAASTSALAGVLPKPDLPLRLTIAPFAAPGRAEAIVAITVGVTQPATPARVQERLDIQVRAFTQGGAERGMFRQSADVVIPPGRSDQAFFETTGELRLKPGVYAIRAAASSERLGKAGSVYADVEIPDFAAAPLSMSGVVLTSHPPPLAARSGHVLPPIVPAAPTTLREFGRASLAMAHVRIYQGGPTDVERVQVRMTIRDEAGAHVAERIESVGSERFAGARSADVRMALPLHELAPGFHLVRLEVTRGAIVVYRDLHVRVR